MPDIRRIDVTQGPGPRMSRCVVRGDNVYLCGLTAADTSQDVKGPDAPDPGAHRPLSARGRDQQIEPADRQSVDQGHGAVRRYELGVERMGRSAEPAGPRLRPRRSGAPRGAGRDHGDRGEVRFRTLSRGAGEGVRAQGAGEQRGGSTALSAARDPQRGGSLEQSYGRSPRSRRQVGNTGEQLS